MPPQMTSTTVIAILTYAHVLSAMGWLGGGILTTFVLGPNLKNLPPLASFAFNAKILPRIVMFVQMMIGSTFLFGILLFYYTFNGEFSTLGSTSQGMDIYAGIILALVVAALAWVVNFPSFKKVTRISEDLLSRGGQEAPPADLAKYSQRARMGSMLGVLLLLVVLATMVYSSVAF